MIPKIKISVRHSNGTCGTYSVTPWVIDQFETMSKVGFIGAFMNAENIQNGHLNLLAFLAERNAGEPVEAWREAYIKSLDEMPAIEIENPQNAETSELSSQS